MGHRSGKEIIETSSGHFGEAGQGHVARGVGDKTACRRLHSFAQVSDG